MWKRCSLTGRSRSQAGLQKPEVEKQAQEAARQLLEETGPFLEELRLNDNVRNRPAEGMGFASTLTELIEAAKYARLTQINLGDSDLDPAEAQEFLRGNSLGAAGNIKIALRDAEQRKKGRQAILDQEYLEGNQDS